MKMLRRHKREGVISFPEGHALHGVRAKVRLEAPHEVLVLLSFGNWQQMDRTKLRTLYRVWGHHVLRDWNVCDEAGRPLPPTGASLASHSNTLGMALIDRWARLVIGYKGDEFEVGTALEVLR